ncbi:ANTAR domain-containing protein [Rhodococcus qingshengii]
MGAVRGAVSGGEWFPPLDAAAEALQELYRALNPADHVEIYLTRLCEHAVDLIEDADMAGVTVLDHGGAVTTAAATSQTVAVVDQLQYRSGSGPFIDAAGSEEVVAADQEAALARWPGFATEAATSGVLSFLSIPLPPHESGPGAVVNLYGSRSDGFVRSEVALMKLFTTAAGFAIAGAERYRGAREVALQLERALDSRSVIDQAKGVLRAVHGVDADAAFAMLVDKSQRTNTKLRVVAEELLDSVRADER